MRVIRDLQGLIMKKVGKSTFEGIVAEIMAANPECDAAPK